MNFMEYKSLLLIDLHNKKKNIHFVLLFVFLNKKMKNSNITKEELRVNWEMLEDSIVMEGGSKYMLAHEHSRQTTIEATKHTHTN